MNSGRTCTYSTCIDKFIKLNVESWHARLHCSILRRSIYIVTFTRRIYDGFYISTCASYCLSISAWINWVDRWSQLIQVPNRKVVLPPKQTYENENENRFRNRGKTTSVDTRKRETQTVKLNLVVFGFDTFPRKKPLVWTFGFENCKAWTNQRAVCCTTWLRVVSRDTEVGFVPGSCWILDQNLQKLSVVCSKEHGFRRTKTVFETVGLSSP